MKSDPTPPAIPPRRSPQRRSSQRRSSQEVAARLETLNTEVTEEVRAASHPVRQEVTAEGPRPPRRWTWTALALAVKIAGFVALPFLVLIGGAVWLYRVQAIPTWLALAVSGILAAGLLTAYAAQICQRLTGEARLRFVFTRLALPLIVFYCGYTLWYFSSVNTKTEEVRQYYTSVHPLLRVALSTAVLFDRDIVVTDTRRELSDYERMGLPPLDNSLHFPQPSGYVHAVDLRTIGRARWRNLTTVAYFRLLGFRTLRHVGSADHLHVSLAPPGDR